MTLREITFTLPNRPGALARVARTLAREKLNLAAISVDSAAGKGRVRLIVNDPDRAMILLRSAGFEVEAREMIAVRLEDRAGTFLRVLEKLAQERINIQSVAILVAREGNQTLVALSTSDLPRTRRVLHRSGMTSQAAERLVSNEELLATAPAIPTESVGLLL
ncbi:MAG TPA: ACT domain-containing protein [Thermoplasmata archaeon]|nr:ACT domain-containing protein [Thermoplasmata archaeon]HYB77265.1 ACT domain-containing protein [Thermoplasmata archaeon]